MPVTMLWLKALFCSRMSYSDFIKNFSRLEICNLTPDTLESEDGHHWNHYQFEGMWRVGSTAGGCRNNAGAPDSPQCVTSSQMMVNVFNVWMCPLATFPSNPQFVVRLDKVDDHSVGGKKGCTFLVGLMQKEGRQQRQLARDLETIGFAIYQVNIFLFCGFL